MWEVARYHRRTFRSIIWYIMLNTYYPDNYVCSRVKKFKNQMQISKIESNCLDSVSTLSKWYSLLNEEHGTTFMLSRTGNKRQFMSPACYSTVCSPQCVEIFLEGTCLSIIILNIFDRDARRSGPTIHFDDDPNIEFVEAYRSLQIGSDWNRLNQIGSDWIRLDQMT